MSALEKQAKVAMFLYDICPNKECACVFRGEFQYEDTCPRCNTSRYKLEDVEKPAKTMLYFSIAAWIQSLYESPDIAR